jgi:putative ABC transport system ATP-binding protein
MNYTNKKPNIQIRNLDVAYNQGKANEVRALSGINLDIYPEEYLIIFGPSGCGKSTLLYSISGLQKPSAGTVIVDGQDINALSPSDLAKLHRAKMGMIFQAFYLIDTLSVIDNVCLPKMANDEGVRERLERGQSLLNRFGIGEQAEKFTGELSGGQKQRVAIARALANNPDVIFADEPVGNLDSVSAYNVMCILRDLNEKDKKTVILVTHDPMHLPYGDRIVHMKDGKIIKIEEVLEKKAPELRGEGWELIKKEPGEEIFKVKKDKGEEIYKISKTAGEEIIRVKRGEKWEIVKREVISPEIAMLTRAFNNFSISQLGMLFAPFKAQELFSHIIFHMPDEFMNQVKKRMQDVITKQLSTESFGRELDLDREKGGAGWDKRNAESFARIFKRIMDQASKIDMEKIDDTANILCPYFIETFGLKLDDSAAEKFIQIIKSRLANRSSVDDVFQKIDLPLEKGGLGLDKRTAFKVSRELEILLLLKFSA